MPPHDDAEPRAPARREPRRRGAVAVAVLRRATGAHDRLRTGGRADREPLEPYAGEPATEYFPFRALAGVHHEMLSGIRCRLRDLALRRARRRALCRGRRDRAAAARAPAGIERRAQSPPRPLPLRAGRLAFGPADSPVRFSDYWEGGTPAYEAPLEIAERRGCDIDPLDVSTRAAG